MMAWTRWREANLTRFVAELTSYYRANRPGCSLIVLGTGDLPIRTIEQRCASSDNWLAWLETGLAHEVLLDTAWDEPRTGRIWATLRQLSLALIAKSGRTFLGTPEAPLSKLHPLIGYSQLPGSPGIEAQYQTLKAAGAPLDQVAFCPASVEQLDQIVATLEAEAKGEAR